MSFTDDVVAPQAAMDRVRELRGMSPINPHKIEGFGANDAPPPSFDNPYPPLDPMEAAAHTPQSPLVPQQTVTTSTATTQEFVYVHRDPVEVWYAGQKVTAEAVLSKVERLVLLELQRGIREKLRGPSKPKKAVKRAVPEGGGGGPDSRGRSVAVRGGDPVDGVAGGPPRRGRGRPKGSKNRPKGGQCDSAQHGAVQEVQDGAGEQAPA